MITDIPNSTIQRILTQELQKISVQAKWVPYDLNETQKQFMCQDRKKFDVLRCLATLEKICLLQMRSGYMLDIYHLCHPPGRGSILWATDQRLQEE